jgi:hypothetical protein
MTDASGNLDGMASLWNLARGSWLHTLTRPEQDMSDEGDERVKRREMQLFDPEAQ